MDELQANGFDYSLVNDELAYLLKEKESTLVGINQRYAKEVGKVFYDAQQAMSDYNNGGLFEKWYTALGFKKRKVYNYIQIYNEVQILHGDELENFNSASTSLQIEASKPSANPVVKQKVLDGDITTHKQYKELESRLKQEQQFREQAEQQVKQLENREPEVVEKEVIPREMKMELTTTKNTLKLAHEELEQLKKDREFYELHKDDFDEEQAEKQRKKLEWESEKNVLEMKVYVDRFLENVAITAFRKGAIASANQSTKNKLQQSVDELKEFTRQMDSVLSGRIEIN